MTMAIRNCFLYRLTPSRSEMLTRSTPAEDAIIDEHFTYLEKLEEENLLLLAGRTETRDNSSLGVVIFSARDESHAREIMLNDPAVKSGVMLAELHNFRLAFLNSKHPYFLE